MGLKECFALASGNKTANEFTREQTNELLLAKKNGVLNTECRKHKEWGPILMNYCWNRETKGQSIDCIYKTAEYLTKFDRQENGLLCDYHEVVDHGVYSYENGRTPIDPALTTSEEGVFDICMFKFLVAKDRQIWKGSKVLWSGRVQMNNVGWLDDTVIMGEGIDQAYQIATSLQSWSANKKSKGNSDDPFAFMAERGWNMLNILLGLDDMNIRGYQLIYAMEFCDGSIERLYEVLDGDRSQDLCDYVNMKSAKDFLAGDTSHNQVAVTNGASFCYDSTDSFMHVNGMQLNMTEFTAPGYAAKECSKLAVDYSSLDVVNRIDTESALRICKARGFQLLRIVNRKSTFGDQNTWIGLYNPETKDYIVASSATPGDICYGGVSLFIHRTIPDEDRRSTYDWNCSSGGHNDQDGTYYEFTHHDGLFRHWEQSKKFVPAVDYNWSLIGFNSYGIPIPKYFELPFMRDAEVFDKLGNKAACIMRDMGSYYFEKLVDGILCLYDQEVKSSVSPHYALYEDWFFKNGLVNLVSAWEASDSQSLGVVALVLAWLKVPDDIVDRLAEGASEYYKKRDAEYGGTSRSWGIVRESNYDIFNKLRKKGLNKTNLLDAVVNGYKLPDPATLPVKLPWL